MLLKVEGKEVEVDAMDSLFREQSDFIGLIDGNNENGNENGNEGMLQDDEVEPEWADIEAEDIQAHTPAVTTQSKRNLLFEVIIITITL